MESKAKEKDPQKTDIPSWEQSILNQIYSTSAFTKMSHLIHSPSFDYHEIYNLYLEISDTLYYTEHISLLSSFLLTNQLKSQYHYSDSSISSKAFIASIKEEETPVKNSILQPNPETVMKLVQICNKLKDSEQFKNAFQVLKELQAVLVDSRLISKPALTFLEVIVMSALSKCKVWTKVLKDAKKTDIPLPELTQWYTEILNLHPTFKDMQVDPCIQSKKHLKMSIKKQQLKKSDPVFLQAIRKKDIRQVEKLLSEGADLETMDPNDRGKHASHIACLNGDLKMMKLLVKYGCDLEALDDEQMTPIYYAIQSEDLTLIDYLISLKVNLEHREYQSRTPFYWACCKSTIKVVEFLYKKGCIYNTYSTLLRSPLSKSCFSSRFKIVKFLLSLPGIEIDVPDNRGRTPLHNAVWGPSGGREGKKVGNESEGDCPEAAELLLKMGAKVDCKDFDGNTPLSVAMSSYAMRSIPVLIKYGANVNEVDNQGETPCFKSAMWGNLEPLKLIYEKHKANPWIKNKEARDCLDAAFDNEYLEVWCYLMNRKEILKKIEKSRLEKWLNESMQRAGRKNRDKEVGWLELLFKLKETGMIILDIGEKSMLEIMKFKDKKLLKRVLKVEKIIEDTKEIMRAVKGAVASNWMEGLMEIHDTFHQKLAKVIFSAREFEGLEKCEAQLLRFVIENLSVDIFEVTEQEETLLYKIVSQRRMDLLLELIKILKEILGGKKIPNEFLKKVDPMRLKSWINFKNKDGFTSLEFAMVRKYMDLHTVLSSFCGQDLKANFDIMKYNLRIDVNVVVNGQGYMHSMRKKLNENITVLKSYAQVEGLQQESVQNNFNPYNIESSKDYLYLQGLLGSELELKATDVIKKEIEGRKLILVDKEESLQAMAKEIHECCSIIGVDLEYFTEEEKDNIGFVCLLQISNLSTDYVIDAILLRNKLKQYLWEIFASQSIVKIFHGSDGDLAWLKSNFDIDVVNLFDTCRAHMLLIGDKNHVSLANLARQHLQLNMSKLYQTADWRVRPLPKSMVDYARLDSRVLLYLWWYLYGNLVKSKETMVKMAIKMNRMCFKIIERSSIKRVVIELCE